MCITCAFSVDKNGKIGLEAVDCALSRKGEALPQYLTFHHLDGGYSLFSSAESIATLGQMRGQPTRIALLQFTSYEKSVLRPSDEYLQHRA